jgi:hypothetical protein
VKEVKQDKLGVQFKKEKEEKYLKKAIIKIIVA